MAAYLANDMYLPGLPRLITDLNTNQSLAELSLSSWFFGSAIMQLILGPISDRFGRRPVILFGLTTFIIASMICAITNNIYTLIIMRFFQGTTNCAIVVAGYSSIHELLETTQAIKTIAWMSTITVLSPALGPTIGALILLIGDWRDTFWVLAIWQGMTFLLLNKFMPESCVERYSIHISNIAQNYLSIFSNFKFIVPTICFSLLFFTSIVWVISSPFLIIQKCHHSPLTYGLIQLLIFSCFIITSQSVRFFIARIPVKKIIYLGLITTLLAAIIALILAIIIPSLIIAIIIPLMIYMLGCGICFSSLNRMAIEACCAPMGAKMSVFSFLLTVSAFSATLFVSTLFNYHLIELCSILLVTSLLGLFLQITEGIKKSLSTNTTKIKSHT